MKTGTLGRSLLVASAVVLLGQSAVAEEGKTVKIGVIGAESGGMVSVGHTLTAATRLAVDEINKAGGINVGGENYMIDLLVRDDRSDVNVAIAATQELVRDEGVKAIFGSESHDFTIAMAKITQPAKVLQFAGNSSLDTVLTPDSVAPGGEDHYLFQTEPQEFQRSGSIARGVTTLLQPYIDHPIKTSVMLVGNDAIGQYLAKNYPPALESIGQTVPEVIFYPPDTTDFSPYLTRAKSYHPDVLHMWYNGDSTLVALPQAVELNVAPGYLVFAVDPGLWEERGLTSEAPVTLSCIPICWGESANADAKAYFERYFAAGAPRGVTSSVSLLYYDYVKMLAKAWEAAGTFDPDATVDALLKLEYDGVVSDTLTFSPRHQVAHATEVCVVEPNTSDQITCSVQEPPAEPPPM